MTRLDGEPKDWARTDRDGTYSVALPGSGRYLLVANARGWSPLAEVLEFHDGATELHLALTDELALAGSIAGAGRMGPGTLLTLHGAGGEFVRATQTCDEGRFSLPLPPAGPYLVTALDPQGGRARALEDVVNALALHVDIEV